MLQNYNAYRLLKTFLYSPTESFRWREISRITSIPPLSTMNYLKQFMEQELITCYEKRGIKFYSANRDNEQFKLYQKLSIQYELNQSTIIEKIWKDIHPEAIILYGSFSRGEGTENSDIDLFVVGKEAKIVLPKGEFFEKVSVKFERFPKKIPIELKRNLINGIVLKGFFNAL